MKKKILKMIAFLTALALIAGLGIFANGLVGNPISKMLVTRTAESYLAENYGDTDFVIDSVNYAFKSGCYYVHVKSPSSIDSYFTLYLTMGGKLTLDCYESMVANGSNTARRLDDDYRKLTGAVFESPAYPYHSQIAYGDLETISGNQARYEDVPAYALIEEDLKLDQLYNIPELGAKAGHLVIYVEEENVTPERAAEIMLEIKYLMDTAGAPFYAMDFVLERPIPEGESPRQEDSITVLQFPYADIYEEGMTDRVKAANEAAIAYYAEKDAEKRMEESVVE